MSRRKYTDKFRASAVVMLEAEGYPHQEGALSRVAAHLHVPLSTLRGWFTAQHNPPPADVRNEKEAELRDLYEGEIRDAIRAMAGKRDDASYRDLGWVIGVFQDKLQNLDGNPTERIEVIDGLSDDERAARIAVLLDRARARRAGQADRDE